MAAHDSLTTPAKHDFPLVSQGQARESLLDSEILAIISDANPVPCFIINAEHLIIHWNRACEKILGIRAGDMIGTNRQWQAFYPQPRATLADLIVENRIHGLGDGLYGNKKLRQSNILEGAYEAEDFFPEMGTEGRWLYFTAAPIHDAQGQIIGAVETLQDITAQKLAEIALQASHDELERKVAERTAELAESNRQLSASLHKAETVNRLKSAFLATVSHELKTPLNGIIGFSDLIAIDHPNDLEGDYARQINHSGRQLFQLVSNMLALTELEAREAHLSIHPFDLQEVFEGLAQEFLPAARGKGIELVLKTPLGAPHVMHTDPRRFREAIAALIDNSIRYMDRAEGRVSVTSSIDGVNLNLFVEDNGPGIPSESIGEMFEKFRVREGFSSRLHGGMGLGLALTRGQIELLGGTIRHEKPTSGRGALFVVRLPGTFE